MNLRKLLLISFVLSGMAALIYQVTWIRPLQFLLGSTTYIISIILAAFMGGLALGSWLIARHVDEIENLPRAYGLMEFGIGLYGVVLLSIFNLLPRVYNAMYGLHGNFYLFMLIQFCLVFAILLIPTTLMGATFPIVARFYAKTIGRGIGEVYSANNIGAIAGSFGAGFILIPLFGIKASILFAGFVNIMVAIAVIAHSDRALLKWLAPAGVAAFLVLGVAGNYNIQQMHSGGFYRTAEVYEELGPVVYYEEGLHATVSVRDLFGRGKSLFINGKGQGSTGIMDLRVNLLLATLPRLLYPDAKEALVIGLGTGTTSGQLARMMNVTTVEIEPKIEGALPYFSRFNLDVLKNPRHELVIDDGRNFILRNTKKYDVIIPEPSDPWQSFSAALFSKEFFELVREDLHEEGLYLQWVPIYQMTPADFQSFYRTFASVFPYVAAFANIGQDEDTPVRFGTSEIILVGSMAPIGLDREALDQNYESLPGTSKSVLDAIRLGSAAKIRHLLLFAGEEMHGYGDAAPVITDDVPILEFSTARQVYSQRPDAVVKDITRYVQHDVE